MKSLCAKPRFTEKINMKEKLRKQTKENNRKKSKEIC